ncbi:MAG TPA: HNH endonuclease family protein [Pseudonocardiaceae bacterium]|jgi:hypothetical protein|nr:HNH endonuclease family protein [Pseudonocardiaceae bacterium]
MPYYRTRTRTRTPRRRHTATALAVIAAAIALVVYTMAHSSPTSASTTPTAATTQLGALPVAADGSMAGYSRDRFGDGWATQPDGCSTRVDVLVDQSTATVTRHHCTVTAGRWVSLYDGLTETDPHALDIDHLVPLADAWRDGAARWTAAQREEFANDLDGGELVAVTAHSNRSKGDDAPPIYEPPNRSEDCAYATGWVLVKTRWHLTVTASEKTALAAMLATCGPDTR